MAPTPDVRPVGDLPDAIGKTSARELSAHGITTLAQVAAHCGHRQRRWGPSACVAADRGRSGTIARPRSLAAKALTSPYPISGAGAPDQPPARRPRCRPCR